MRIKQQNRVSSKRPQKRKHSTMSVDDDVLTTSQSQLNEVFVAYRDRYLIMNSDCTRIPQSMMPTKRARTSHISNSIVINGSVTINNSTVVNNFNVPHNTKSVADEYGNKYVTTESGNMSHATLIQFIRRL